MSLYWKTPGRGIDFEPCCDLYGFSFGETFFGVVIRARENPKASPLARTSVKAKFAEEMCEAQDKRIIDAGDSVVCIDASDDSVAQMSWSQILKENHIYRVHAAMGDTLVLDGIHDPVPTIRVAVSRRYVRPEDLSLLDSCQQGIKWSGNSQETPDLSKRFALRKRPG
jgi:hypothetical protein